MTNDAELIACTPQPLRADGFNPDVELPYGLQADHIRAAMNGFVEFLGFINQQLHSREMQRIETILMPANFSIVGEFMAVMIPLVEGVGAKLTKRDWIFSGRSGSSRRTITASVTESGYRKMMRNWIYKDAV